MTKDVKTVAVIGAGAMGAGIAQLSALAGYDTLLADANRDALTAGLARVDDGLARMERRARLGADARAAALARCRTVGVEAVGGAQIVIEAVPERAEIKQALFARISEIVGATCVLATNTSSISITEIAAAARRPERVVGMHFFNPAPVMALVEVIAGELTGEAALHTTRQVARSMGKRVIDAADVPGFVVNRVNRPFSLEALRLLEQRVASVEQIDRIARLGAGFRLGPFELMDLIGIDVNHAVAESFLRQSYGEARYRPSPLAARKVLAGRLGRKTGAGWYTYESGDGVHGDRTQQTVPEPRDVNGTATPLAAAVVLGDLPVAEELRQHARAAGVTVVTAVSDLEGSLSPRAAELVIDCRGEDDHADTGDLPRARLLDRGSLYELDPYAVGFHVMPPLESVRLLEATATPWTDPLAVAALEGFATALNWEIAWVGDGPGLVLGRILAQLVNEAAFSIEEGAGSPSDIDDGMRLGVGHPRGPIEWSTVIGLRHVLNVLAGLHRELGDPRYRPAPSLRRAVALDLPLGAI